MESNRIVPVDIAREMQQSYLDYAMSVIVSRALPDVRDGLKPVHRRILYAMREAGNTPDRPYKKSARTVGDVLGKYHPHGDAAVYDALVRLAQDFSMRYPLIDGHGNFGSVDGDPPAAMRYTEARLAPIAMELLADLDKDTVDFEPNFDGNEQEPVVLPARFPNFLANGASGIAVGMATNVPPHNLGELIDALVALIERPDLTTAELMRYVPGPDFPTGGFVVGREGIRAAYETGRGVITLRGRAQIEEAKGGRQRIVITELPYEVNKARLIERIAELVREKKVDGISDLRDETDRTGLRVVVELAKGANANVVLNRLYRNTQLQESYGIIMLALVDGRPRVLSLREALGHYLDHQKQVVRRRTQFDLRRAEDRAHVLEGLRVALDHIDAVIALIRASRTVDEARAGLMREFGLSERQAQAILDMRLQRLTGLEREKVLEELASVLQEIQRLRAILASEDLLLNVIREELMKVRERFADARRTRIIAGEADFDEEDLIAEEDVVVTLTHRGYIKRLPLDTYRSQHRGGRGVTGLSTRDDDFVEHLFVAGTHHWVLFFTNRGRMYRLKVHEVPEAGRTARGVVLANCIPLEEGEQVTAVVPVQEFQEAVCLCMATRRGIVKKTDLAEFVNARRTGIIAISLDEGDELIAVRLVPAGADVVLVTRAGMAIRFSGDEVRAMGRTARGVAGIALEPGDQVVAMELAEDGADLLVVTQMGYGKRTPYAAYRRQSRGGKGLKTIRSTDRNGPIVGALTVRSGDEVMCISSQGLLIRQPVADIPVLGRDTLGVRVMRLEEGETLVAVAPVVAQGEDV